ncbi:hypothetical protein BJY01DRAFT_226926 [Aspergillus pseudoustus]|uniref:Ankyrin repeat-containing domain protein n=1 Tax=Aspergillus pseudoustus TaxID=1810923 RepID=A0ABR4ITW0_9EURO
MVPRPEQKIRMLRLLLAYNAATDQICGFQTYDITYYTPLANAIVKGWVDIAELLFQNGAAYPLEINNGYLPLETLRFCSQQGQERYYACFSEMGSRCIVGDITLIGLSKRLIRESSIRSFRR